MRSSKTSLSAASKTLASAKATRSSALNNCTSRVRVSALRLICLGAVSRMKTEMMALADVARFASGSLENASTASQKRTLSSACCVPRKRLKRRRVAASSRTLASAAAVPRPNPDPVGRVPRSSSEYRQGRAVLRASPLRGTQHDDARQRQARRPSRQPAPVVRTKQTGKASASKTKSAHAMRYEEAG